MEHVQFEPSTVVSIISPYYGSILDNLDSLYVPVDPEFVDRFIRLCKACQDESQDSEYRMDHSNSDESFQKHKRYGVVRQILNDHNAALTSNFRMSQILDCHDDNRIAANLFRVIAFPYWYGEKLRLASERGGMAIVRDLVDRGCSPLSGDGNGINSIHHASSSGQIEPLQYLLKEATRWTSSESLIVNSTDKSGWTPLIYAIQSLQVEAVSFLLQQPHIQVNAPTLNGRTAIFYALDLAAVSTIGMDIVKLLVKAGADLDAEDKYGNSVFHSCGVEVETILRLEQQQKAKQIEEEEEKSIHD